MSQYEMVLFITFVIFNGDFRFSLLFSLVVQTGAIPVVLTVARPLTLATLLVAFTCWLELLPPDRRLPPPAAGYSARQCVRLEAGVLWRRARPSLDAVLAGAVKRPPPRDTAKSERAGLTALSAASPLVVGTLPMAFLKRVALLIQAVVPPAVKDVEVALHAAAWRQRVAPLHAEVGTAVVPLGGLVARPLDRLSRPVAFGLRPRGIVLQVGVCLVRAPLRIADVRKAVGYGQLSVDVRVAERNKGVPLFLGLVARKATPDVVNLLAPVLPTLRMTARPRLIRRRGARLDAVGARPVFLARVPEVLPLQVVGATVHGAPP